MPHALSDHNKGVEEWIPTSSLCEFLWINSFYIDLSLFVSNVTFECACHEAEVRCMLLWHVSYGHVWCDLRDIVGKAVKLKLSDMRAKRRLFSNTSKFYVHCRQIMLLLGMKYNCEISTKVGFCIAPEYMFIYWLVGLENIVKFNVAK